MRGESTPIDFVQLPTITLSPNAVLWLVDPEPQIPGGDVNVELASGGGEMAIKFITNASWQMTVRTPAQYDLGFTIKDGDTQVKTKTGSAGTSSSDIIEVIVNCPQNTSLGGDPLFGVFDLSINGSSCAVHVYVTSEAPYITVSDSYQWPEGGHLFKVPATINTEAFIIPLETNVRTFKIYYNGSESGCPD